MKKITLIVISALALIGCGGGSSTPIGYTGPKNDRKQSTVDVEYTLNGTKRPTCHNADDIGDIAPENTDTVRCSWLCGRYNNHSARGNDTIFVALEFKKSESTDEGVWELSDEDLSEASSTVCRDM